MNKKGKRKNRLKNDFKNSSLRVKNSKFFAGVICPPPLATPPAAGRGFATLPSRPWSSGKKLCAKGGGGMIEINV